MRIPLNVVAVMILHGYTCMDIQAHVSFRSQNQQLTLIVARTNSVKSGDQMFSKVGPTLWITLPRNIRDCQYFSLFKLAYD